MVQAKPVTDNNVQMREAINSLFESYEELGMIGVVSAVKHCYKDLSSPQTVLFLYGLLSSYF